MKKLTIKCMNKKQGAFQVIVRNVIVTESSRQDESFVFYATTNSAFVTKLNQLKAEYSLSIVKSGLNAKGEVIVQLT